MNKFAVGLVAALAVLGSASAQNDVDILNFALNLECLEAAFYSCAAYGLNLTTAYLGGGGPVTGCQQADLKGPALEYAQEIAQDELNHVRFLRVNLGNASVPCPAMDIGPAFAALGKAALGNAAPEGFPAFSPYFDPIAFYAGAFVFEDVGVTAYLGAAPLVQNKGVLSAAARILSAEGYHAGIIRAVLANLVDFPTPQGVTVGTLVNSIAAARAALSGTPDFGITDAAGEPITVAAGASGLAVARTPQEVLQIVYGTGDATKPGLFYPQGVTGYFSPRNLLNG